MGEVLLGCISTFSPIRAATCGRCCAPSRIGDKNTPFGRPRADARSSRHYEPTGPARRGWLNTKSFAKFVCGKLFHRQSMQVPKHKRHERMEPPSRGIDVFVHPIDFSVAQMAGDAVAADAGLYLPLDAGSEFARQNGAVRVLVTEILAIGEPVGDLQSVLSLVVCSARHGNLDECPDLARTVILGAAWLHDPDTIVGHALHRALEVLAVVGNNIEPLPDERRVGFVGHGLHYLGASGIRRGGRRRRSLSRRDPITGKSGDGTVRDSLVRVSRHTSRVCSSSSR